MQNINRLGETLPPPFCFERITSKKNSRIFFGANVKIKEKFLWNNQKSWTGGLNTLKIYQEENKLIIYLDETWLDNDMTVKKWWQSNEVFGAKGGIRSSGRLIIVPLFHTRV
jgi:hypothetical protein